MVLLDKIMNCSMKGAALQKEPHREPILQNYWIIWSFLLYFNFKSFKDSKILRHSLDFNALYMIQEYFSRTFTISKN